MRSGRILCGFLELSSRPTTSSRGAAQFTGADMVEMHSWLDERGPGPVTFPADSTDLGELKVT